MTSMTSIKLIQVGLRIQFYTRQQGVWIKYEESLYKNDLGSSCKLIKKTCSKARSSINCSAKYRCDGKE